jgi:hypothetical protein
MYEWLVPGSQMAARLYQINGKAPTTLESADQFFFRNHITPLVPTNDFARAAQLKSLETQYLTPAAQWRP